VFAQPGRLHDALGRALVQKLTQLVEEHTHACSLEVRALRNTEGQRPHVGHVTCHRAEQKGARGEGPRKMVRFRSGVWPVPPSAINWC
jgi:hypothetical protein